MYNGRGLEMSGVTYSSLATESIPRGYASVPVQVNNDENELIRSWWLAWSVSGYRRFEFDRVADGYNQTLRWTVDDQEET